MKQYRPTANITMQVKCNMPRPHALAQMCLLCYEAHNAAIWTRCMVPHGTEVHCRRL